MRLMTLSALVLAALVPADPAKGWNYTGHRTIASIAYDELTPPVRGKVDAILPAHPRYEKDLLGEMPQGYAQPPRYAFAMAAYWPDIIRSQSNPMHFTHHRPMWHFINVPFELADWKPSTAPAISPVGSGAAAATTTARTATTRGVVEGPKDVLEAIAKNRDDLRNPSLTDAQRAVAICWLAHLVGDLHQPLHATTLYSAQFPDGDQGGNRFIISLRRQNVNLHAVWDEMLGYQTSAVMIDYLAAAIRNDRQFARDALPESAERDPAVWMKESHELGKRVVYRDGALVGVNSDDLRRDPTIPVPLLPDGYQAEAEAVALRRAALAAHRLADLLNAALAD